MHLNLNPQARTLLTAKPRSLLFRQPPSERAAGPGTGTPDCPAARNHFAPLCAGHPGAGELIVQILRQQDEKGCRMILVPIHTESAVLMNVMNQVFAHVQYHSLLDTFPRAPPAPGESLSDCIRELAVTGQTVESISARLRRAGKGCLYLPPLQRGDSPTAFSLVLWFRLLNRLKAFCRQSAEPTGLLVWLEDTGTDLIPWCGHFDVVHSIEPDPLSVGRRISGAARRHAVIHEQWFDGRVDPTGADQHWEVSI